MRRWNHSIEIVIVRVNFNATAPRKLACLEESAKSTSCRIHHSTSNHPVWLKVLLDPFLVKAV